MKVRRTAPILLLLLCCGCSFLSRSHSRFFSLERIPPEKAVAGTLTGTPVGIGVVELPPGMDRKEIVVRDAGNQLLVRETDQWTALLEPMVLHTLAFDLAGRLPEGAVILPGQEKPAGASRSIDVIFGDLAAGPGPTVVLDAHWSLRGSGADATATARHERITIDLPSLESAAVAEGLSRAIAALADRMAEQVIARSQ